jgi:hypothetical protein
MADLALVHAWPVRRRLFVQPAELLLQRLERLERLERLQRLDYDHGEDPAQGPASASASTPAASGEHPAADDAKAPSASTPAAASSWGLGPTPPRWARAG